MQLGYLMVFLPLLGEVLSGFFGKIIGSNSFLVFSIKKDLVSSLFIAIHDADTPE